MRMSRPPAAAARTTGRAFGPQEERELDDPAAAQLQHLQRPRLVAARLAGLVLAERRRAVCRDRRDHTRTPASDTRPQPPGKDVVPTGKPQVIGRHRLRGVLMDECCQGVDVVCLESSHVTRQQLAVGQPQGQVGAGRGWACSPPSSFAHAARRCSPRRRWSRGSATSLAFHCSTSHKIRAAAGVAGDAAGRPRMPAAPNPVRLQS